MTDNQKKFLEITELNPNKSKYLTINLDTLEFLDELTLKYPQLLLNDKFFDLIEEIKILSSSIITISILDKENSYRYKHQIEIRFDNDIMTYNDRRIIFVFDQLNLSLIGSLNCIYLRKKLPDSKFSYESIWIKNVGNCLIPLISGTSPDEHIYYPKNIIDWLNIAKSNTQIIELGRNHRKIVCQINTSHFFESYFAMPVMSLFQNKTVLNQIDFENTSQKEYTYYYGDSSIHGSSYHISLNKLWIDLSYHFEDGARFKNVREYKYKLYLPNFYRFIENFKS